ncbi:ANTAR domain-containing protein [Auraticoccus cholistanensis]|nr:ANTAR domain-containing protein [Auraticoccus cholistanensis]
MEFSVDAARWHSWASRLVEAPTARMPLELLALACELVPGGSVSLRLDPDEIHLSDPRPGLLEEEQTSTGAGPATMVGPTALALPAADVAATWPPLAAAVDGTGLRSCLALALVVGEQRLGSLTLWAPGPEALEEPLPRVAGALAALASVVLALRRREQQLEEAIASRDVLGQAKGILMERLGLDPDQAFELLTAVSQRRNSKVRAIAEQLTTAGELE